MTTPTELKKFTHILVVVVPIAAMFSFPAYAMAASPYQKQAEPAQSESVVTKTIDNIDSQMDIVDIVADIEGLYTFEENGHTYTIQASDKDARSLKTLYELPTNKVRNYEKLRYGHTVYNWISTTSAVRGAETTAELMKHLKVDNWSVDEDGFVKDGNGYVVCAGTSIAYHIGDMVATPAGAGKIYDVVLVGLDKILCYYEQ